MPRRRFDIIALLVVLGLAAVAGCTDDGGPAPVQPDPVWWSISLFPSVQRGDSAVPVLKRKEVAVPEQPRTWAAVPATSVRFAANGYAHFLESGRVTIQAFVDGALVADTVIDVARPAVILFDQIVNGNRDVYSIALDGRNETRLTTHAAADQDAVAELDTLVFTSDRDGNAEIYAKAVNGGAEQRLTFTAAEEREVAVYTYPDLRPYGPPPTNYLEIAYARNDGGVFKLWYGERLLATPTRVAPGHGPPSTVESSPSFTFIGALIFVSTATGVSQIFAAGLGSDPPSHYQIQVGPGPNFEAHFHKTHGPAFISTRTGTAKLYMEGFTTPIVPGPGSEREPTLTGGSVVFVSDRSGSGQLYWVDPWEGGLIHHIPVTGSDPRRPSLLWERSHY